MNAAIVAVPTAMTAEVLAPASMLRLASGSSIRRSRAPAGSPRAMPDSLSGGAMSARPLAVFRTMGSNAYRKSATTAGAVPAAVLALAVQWGFEGLERWLVPAGLRLSGEAGSGADR